VQLIRDFDTMWNNNPGHYTWHFTVLTGGTVYQHFPTQAVTKSRIPAAGGHGPGTPVVPVPAWLQSRSLEAWCVVVSFEPVVYRVFSCPTGVQGVTSRCYSYSPPSNLWPNSDCRGCDYKGEQAFGDRPFTVAQRDSAVNLAKWLFTVAYGWGAPVKNQNVFGAEGWGDAIFDYDPGPAPPLAIPWRKPVAGGSLGSGWNANNPSFWSCDGGYHRAQDIIGVAEGSPIVAAAGNHSGNGCRVVSRGLDSQVGNWVRLSHSEPADCADYGLPRIDTMYAHMQSLAYVSPNEWIDSNRIIGRVGQTGGTGEGVHLHLAVYEFATNAIYDGVATSGTPFAPCANRKDPMNYLPSW